MIGSVLYTVGFALETATESGLLFQTVMTLTLDLGHTVSSIFAAFGIVPQTIFFIFFGRKITNTIKQFTAALPGDVDKFTKVKLVLFVAHFLVELVYKSSYCMVLHILGSFNCGRTDTILEQISRALYCTSYRIQVSSQRLLILQNIRDRVSHRDSEGFATKTHNNLRFWIQQHGNRKEGRTFF